MKGKNHTANQIIDKFRRVESITEQGSTIAQAAKLIEVTEPTYYRWKKKYGRMDKQDIRWLKEVKRRTADSKNCWQIISDKIG